MSDTFRHFLRIGIHSEADFFRKGQPLYDALIMNANLVQATPSASAALVYQLKKPFLIDPLTYAFSLNPKYLMSRSKGKSGGIRVKKSFTGLADSYFADRSFLGNRPLQMDDFEIGDLTARVLSFQKEVLVRAVGDTKELFSDIGRLNPAWLIAPYFPLRRSQDWDASLSLNVACLEAARAQGVNPSAIVPVELEILRQPDALQKIADAYAAAKPDAIFLWIESFDEDRADESDLTTYCSLVARLAKAGTKPVNLFGGFFSCLAQCVGLAGFAHGLVYGENRAFTPVVGGGQPPPRYYLKPAHVSMNVREAEVLLAGVSPSDYLQENCDCAICRELFDGEADLTNFAKFSETNDQGKFIPRAYALCRFHFLFARKAEITGMEELSPHERLGHIAANAKFMNDIHADDYAEHLMTWTKVIGEFC